jgi:hypothetical protein
VSTPPRGVVVNAGAFLPPPGVAAQAGDAARGRRLPTRLPPHNPPSAEVRGNELVFTFISPDMHGTETKNN